MIDVLIITDGRRDCVHRAASSARVSLVGDIGQWWVYDDTGDPDHAAWLRGLFPHANVFQHPDGRQGFGGAIAYAWSELAAGSDASHIFHLEDDFTFNRDIPVDKMAVVLDSCPEIVQMALRRQPWNDAEKAAGGVVELQPDEFHDAFLATHHGSRFDWLEHQLFWTTNPSLIRRQHIIDHPWPNVEQSEGIYTRQLLDHDPDYRFGYWGARDSGEWVHHIGDRRAGTGY